MPIVSVSHIEEQARFGVLTRLLPFLGEDEDLGRYQLRPGHESHH